MRIADVLYGALGKLAASRGTMNNLTFGDESFTYYETICGGTGAGRGFDGADAVLRIETPGGGGYGPVPK